MQITKQAKYYKAQERIKQIKKFQGIVLTIILASIFMIGFSAFLYYSKAEDAFVPITIFLATTLGLLIILFMEYLKTFKTNFILGSNWEERQIEKYLEEDKTTI